jgi:hypothetical protein
MDTTLGGQATKSILPPFASDTDFIIDFGFSAMIFVLEVEVVDNMHVVAFSSRSACIIGVTLRT